MFSLQHLFSSLLGCGLLGLACAPVPAGAHFSQVSVAERATSSPQVTVVTDVNGKTTKKTVDAPYGLASSVDSETVNGKTVTHASTTPLTKADARKLQQDMRTQEQQMNAQFAQMQREMNQMFAQEHAMFRGL